MHEARKRQLEKKLMTAAFLVLRQFLQSTYVPYEGGGEMYRITSHNAHSQREGEKVRISIQKRRKGACGSLAHFFLLRSAKLRRKQPHVRRVSFKGDEFLPLLLSFVKWVFPYVSRRGFFENAFRSRTATFSKKKTEKRGSRETTVGLNLISNFFTQKKGEKKTLVIGASSSSMINESTYISSPCFLGCPFMSFWDLGARRREKGGRGPKKKKRGKRTGTQDGRCPFLLSHVRTPADDN